MLKAWVFFFAACVVIAPSAVRSAPAGTDLARCGAKAELRKRFSPGFFDCRGCNVLFLDLDGLRGDRLGYAGYDSSISPFIDSLAKRGIVFRNAIAQSDWTSPSVASLQTSQYPSALGLTTTKDLPNREAPTIFNTLAAKGYQIVDRTHGAADIMVSSFDQPDYVAQIYDSIAAMSSGPTVAYILNMDLHRPYNRIAPQTPAELSDPVLMAGHHLGEYLITATTAQATAMNLLYDQRVRHIDGKLKDLFTVIEGKGLLEKTIVFFYSNHGEQIFEHGKWGHGTSYYDEEIRVPLIMLHPRVDAGNATTVCTEVELIDLAATALDLLGFGDARLGKGRSLIPVVSGREDARAFKFAFSEGASMSESHLKMVRTRRWKLVSTIQGSYQLYDLENDPAERHDVKGMNKNILEEMKAVLDQWEKSNRLEYPPRTYQPSEAEKAELRKRGYW